MALPGRDRQVWRLARSHTLRGLLAGLTLVSSAADPMLMPRIVREDLHHELSEEQLGRLLPKLDADKDGQLSLSELVRHSDHMRRTFAEKEAREELPNFDEDKDGKVSREEFLSQVRGGELPQEGAEASPEANLHQEHAAALFAAGDGNGDGVLDQEEFGHTLNPESSPRMVELTAKSFARNYDRDGDGLLTEEEFLANGAAGPHAETLRAKFKRLDKDASGKLDASELATLATGKFTADQDMEDLVRRCDIDGDGRVSLEELQVTRGELARNAAGHHLSIWTRHHEL